MASTESIDDSMSRSCLALFEPDQLWQRAREPMFWLGPTFKLVWVNQAWENLTGYSAESVAGLTCNTHGPTGAGGLADLATSFHPPPSRFWVSQREPCRAFSPRAASPFGAESNSGRSATKTIPLSVSWDWCARPNVDPVLLTRSPASFISIYWKSGGASRSDMASMAWSALVRPTGVWSSKCVWPRHRRPQC